MPDKNLFVSIKTAEYDTPGRITGSHWHEQIHFFYFSKGSAVVRCNSKDFTVGSNDLVIINSKEVHFIENISGELTVTIIKIDLSFIYSSRIDSIQAQFISPLSQNLILFENVVRNDETILKCINGIISEYFEKKIGFEIAIKSLLYEIIVLLLRGHTKKIYDENEFNSQLAMLERFKNVINYMESNFTEKIDLAKLSDIAGFSEGHFCRSFKQITGMTAIDYINNLRINMASKLIKNSDLTMTEISMRCGFSDSNYFSRIFKKHKKISPVQMKKSSGRY